MIIITNFYVLYVLQYAQIHHTEKAFVVLKLTFPIIEYTQYI